MIQFGTGGWRAVIGDGFTRDNIRRIAAALARRMVREDCAAEGLCAGYDRRFLSKEALTWFCEVLAGEEDLPLEDEGLRIERRVFADGGDGGVRLFAAAGGVEESCAFKADELLVLRMGGGHLLELQVRVVVELQFAEPLDEFDVQLQIVGQLRRGKHGRGQADEKACPIFHIGHGLWKMNRMYAMSAMRGGDWREAVSTRGERF